MIDKFLWNFLRGGNVISHFYKGRPWKSMHRMQLKNPCENVIYTFYWAVLHTSKLQNKCLGSSSMKHGRICIYIRSSFQYLFYRWAVCDIIWYIFGHQCYWNLWIWLTFLRTWCTITREDEWGYHFLCVSFPTPVPQYSMKYVLYIAVKQQVNTCCSSSPLYLAHLIVSYSYSHHLILPSIANST